MMMGFFCTSLCIFYNDIYVSHGSLLVSNDFCLLTGVILSGMELDVSIDTVTVLDWQSFLSVR